MNVCENMLIYLALLLFSDFGDRKPYIFQMLYDSVIIWVSFITTRGPLLHASNVLTHVGR